MAFELMTEEWETGLAVGIETTFAEAVNPTLWVPGTCDLEHDEGIRENKMPINEREETHLALGGISCDGAIAIQVCPGQEAMLFGDSGILSWKDRRHPASFTAVKVVGDREALWYRGVCVDSYSVKGAREENLVLELDCLGVDETPAPPANPNYANLAAPYILEELDLWVDNKPRISFDSIEVGSERSLRDDIYGNSRYRQDITSQGVSNSLTLEGWRDENNDLRTAYRNHATVAVVAKWTRGSNWVQAAVAYAQVMKCNPDNVREPVEMKCLKAAGSSVSGIEWTYG